MALRKTPVVCAVTLAVISACTADISDPSDAPSEGGHANHAGASSAGGAPGGRAGAAGGVATAGAGALTSGGSGAGSGGAVNGGATSGGAPPQAGTSSGTSGSHVSGGSSGGSSGTAGAGGTASGGGEPGPGCTPPTEYPNLFVSLLGQTQADVDAKIAAAWSQLYNPSNANTVFYNGPGSDESYVQDVANNDVRTEGMSYGMMTAVQLDHQAEFDRLWTFVKKHMLQSNGQFTWHTTTSGSPIGQGSAPDGDEYFATALIFAAKRWGATGKHDYAADAQATLDTVRKQEFHQMSKIVQFTPGSGNTDGSYVLPAFYETWACFDAENREFWSEAVKAGRAFFQAAADSNGVIPDRSSFSGQAQSSAGSDAVRCVMNIMMDHNFFKADPWQTTYATKYGTYIKTHSNNTTAMLACNGLLGFGLPEETGKPFVQALWSAKIPTGTYRYYDGTLYLLALLHVSGAFKLWY